HVGSLQHFRRQRHDLHEALGTQFTRDRPEDAGANGFELGVEQYGSVTAKADERAVLAANALGGANHHGVIDFAFLDAPTRSGVFDAHLDNVANSGVATLGAAQHLDAHDSACTSVIGHVKRGLHLNHDLPVSNLNRQDIALLEKQPPYLGDQFWPRQT